MLGIAGPPRAAPWPAHVLIGDEMYMVAEDPQTGALMVSQRPPNQDDVVPTDYGANASNPAFGKWQPYNDFSFGTGLKIQRDYNDRKSRLVLGMDTSQSNKLFKGPNITTQTPATTDSTNGWLDFFEIGGSLHGVVGRYCLKRTADATFGTTGGHDFGSGKTARKGTAVFQDNTSGTTYAFIPMSGSEKAYHFDGTSFTQFSTFTALCFCQVGSEFYRASGTNLVSKVDTDADPTVEANWTADNQFHIGDGTSEIIQMWSHPTSAGDILLILKTDGIYSIDGNGDDIPYYGKLLKRGTGVDNGKAVWSFADDTFAMFNGTTYRIHPDLTLEPIGPELEPTNDSEVRGYISAGMGHGTINAYGGLYNQDTGDSYLMEFGTYQDYRLGLSGNEFPVANVALTDGWTGSISQKFAGKKITTMWESTIGAAAGHTRAWLGFSDGTYGYFPLACTHDKTACASYEYTTTDGTIQPPLFTGLFGGNNKVVMSARVAGTTLTSTEYVQIGYKSDPSAGSYTDWGVHFSTNGERSDLDTSFAGSLIDFQFTFVNGSTSTSPVVNVIETQWALQYDDLRQVFEFDILAEDGLQALDGRPFRRMASEIRSALRTAGTAATGMTVVLPNEDSKVLRLFSYGETTVRTGRLRRVMQAVHIKAAETSTNVVYGTVERLRPYTIGDLAGLTVGQLGGI